MLPVFAATGRGGVLVDEREFAVGVRVGDAVELGEGDGLDGGEALGGASVEILERLLAIETVEELPGGVGEVEEGFAVGGAEEAVVVADFEAGRGAAEAVRASNERSRARIRRM